MRSIFSIESGTFGFAKSIDKTLTSPRKLTISREREDFAFIFSFIDSNDKNVSLDNYENLLEIAENIVFVK